jgi:hypothetical protein
MMFERARRHDKLAVLAPLATAPVIGLEQCPLAALVQAR